MNERAKILQMVKEGVITVEEAEKLLNQIEDQTDTKKHKERAAKNIAKAKDALVGAFSEIETQLDKFGHEVEGFVKESIKVVESKLDKVFKKEKENNDNE